MKTLQFLGIVLCCFLPSQQCQIGVSGCLTCSNNACIQCDIDNGYLLSGDICCDTSSSLYPVANNQCGSCELAVPGCLICSLDPTTNNVQCAVCDSMSLQFPDGQGNCLPCWDIIPGCSLCLQLVGVQCISCNQSNGYILSGKTCCNTNANEYPNSNYTCSSCSQIFPGCTNCQLFSNTVTCTACNQTQGFYLSGQNCCNMHFGQCMQCSVAIPGCINCQYNEQIQTMGCVECSRIDGYALSGITCCNIKEDSFPDGSGTCASCQAVISGCITCLMGFDEVECIVCDFGNFLAGNVCCDSLLGLWPDHQTDGCSSCQNIYQGCLSCAMGGDGITKCEVCDVDKGYYVSGRSCCHQSLDLYPDAEGGCSPCSVVITGCQTCQFSDETLACTQCNINGGYFPSDGRCTGCSTLIPNCLTCTSTSAQSQCTQCSPQHILLDSLTCLSCPQAASSDGLRCITCASINPYCLTCANQNTCTMCVDSYHVVNSTLCIQCLDDACVYTCSIIHPACVSCNNTICTSCLSGYAVYTRGDNVTCRSCRNIDKNCVSCTIQTEYCTQCRDGYALVEGACVMCSAGHSVSLEGDSCVSCSLLDSSCVLCGEEVCVGCYYGFSLVGTVCYNCAAFHSYCATCTSLGCTSCRMGYALVGQACSPVPVGVWGLTTISSVTVGCGGGCMLCTGMFCQLCMVGYALDSGVCIPCDSNCKYCVHHDIITCGQCYTGSYLAGGYCTSCPAYCQYCDESACFRCSDGYYLDNTQCKECPDSCDVCQDGICVECAKGYSVSAGQCVQCLVGCTTCNIQSYEKCGTCAEGYYQQGEQCKRCPTLCSSCTSSTHCLSCSIGSHYNQQTYQCKQSCNFPCLTCEENNPTKCLSCFGGYTFIQEDQKCQEVTICIENCEMCPREYYLESGLCISCDRQNCIHCNSDGCSQCIEGYYVDKGQCEACSEGCEVCLSGSYCIQCDSGYFATTTIIGDISGNCQPCSSEHFCLECKDEPHLCTKCMDGFEFAGLKCVSSTRLFFTIALNLSSTKFYSRINQFKHGLISILGGEYEGKQHYVGLVEVSGSSPLSIKGQITTHSHTDIYKAKQIMENGLDNSQMDTFKLSTYTLTVVGGDVTQQQSEIFPVSGIVVITLMSLAIITLIVILIIRERKRAPEPNYSIQREDSEKDLSKD